MNELVVVLTKILVLFFLILVLFDFYNFLFLVIITRKTKFYSSQKNYEIIN